MGKCRLFGKKGLFLSLNESDLCRICAVVVGQDVERSAQILKESMELVEKTKNPDTLMSRLDLVESRLDALIEYETRGIPTLQPVPSELKAALTADRGRILSRVAAELTQAALAKAALSSSSKRARTAVEKAQRTICDMGGRYGHPAELEDSLDKLARYLDRAAEGG